MSFQCQRCSHTGRYSSWVTARWHLEPMLQRCERCGTSHSCERGAVASVITPQLQGIHVPGRLSPWHDARYVPCVVGAFECCWASGLTVRLWWTGSAWTWAGRRVDTSTMQKWRGTWLTPSN